MARFSFSSFLPVSHFDCTVSRACPRDIQYRYKPRIKTRKLAAEKSDAAGIEKLKEPSRLALNSFVTSTPSGRINGETPHRCYRMKFQRMTGR